MMELKGKKIAVLGMGPDGVEMVRALALKGAEVWGLGIAASSQIQEIKDKLSKVPCHLHFKKAGEKMLTKFDLLVDTPGAGNFAQAREYARAQGVLVISDLDLACRFIRAPIIAVTGTNGKSSTIAMIGTMLQKQGYKVGALGGDYHSWSDPLLTKKKVDFYLLEVSSKRLEKSASFHPQIAVLLNLFPAHGARHEGGLPAYFAAKAKIFGEQGENDYLVHEASALNVRELIRQNHPRSQRIMFSLTGPLEGSGVYLDKKELVWKGLDGRVEHYSMEKSQLPLAVHLLNFMAALCVARLVGVSPSSIQSVLDEFPGLPHRLEKVRTVGGVTFIDDSRSTNVGATIWALSSFSKSVIWIAGGKVEKDARLDELPRAAKTRLKCILLLGPKKKHLSKVWEGMAPTGEAENIKMAVKKAYEKAEEGDFVIYSPACPPDFRSERHGRSRGEDFKKSVYELVDKPREIRVRPSFRRI